MDLDDFGPKLAAVFAETNPDSPVSMHYVLALWKDGSRVVSHQGKEALIEELRRFLKEVERSY